jgi:hypothetical protein
VESIILGVFVMLSLLDLRKIIAPQARTVFPPGEII